MTAFPVTDVPAKGGNRAAITASIMLATMMQAAPDSR
jgi:hypothetical protein